MDRTRQYSPTVDGIRPDHVKRYEFAASRIPKGSYVLDLACGCGYGSWIMEQAGLNVTGVDISREAIEYAQRHYKGPTYWNQKAQDTRGRWDVLVSFETIEHLADPEVIFQNVKADSVIASVPNEERYPFSVERFAGDEYPHLRHYTPAEFDDFFKAQGFEVVRRFCQPDKQGAIIPGTSGMFLIYIAKRLPQR